MPTSVVVRLISSLIYGRSGFQFFQQKFRHLLDVQCGVPFEICPVLLLRPQQNSLRRQKAKIGFSVLVGVENIYGANFALRDMMRILRDNNA